MTDAEKQSLRSYLVSALQFAVGNDYVHLIADSILDDVAADIEAAADEDYNSDDVRMAVGRVLCSRLKVEMP